MTAMGSGTTDGPGKALLGSQVGLFPGRLDAIEWVRVAAASGVVWFHITGGPFKEIGYAGLICFILISVVFQAAGSEKDGFAEYLKKKAIRIVPPWLFWFGFYGLFNLAKGKELFPYSEGITANILTGTWVGLWYLPFILIASPVVFALARVTAGWNAHGQAAAFLCLGVTMQVLLPQANGSGKGWVPWGQWLHALPAIPIGLGLFGVLRTKVDNRWVVTCVYLAVVEAVCLALMHTNRNIAIPYGVAVAVVSVGFLIPSRLPHPMTRLGELCLGVYLVHSAIISVLKNLSTLMDDPWVLFAAGVVLSFMVTSLMRRNRWLAKVF